MIVMKFGGSSVANAERIRHVASIIKAYSDKKPVVVLSAMGDTTDHLLASADLAVLWMWQASQNSMKRRPLCSV